MFHITMTILTVSDIAVCVSQQLHYFSHDISHVYPGADYEQRRVRSNTSSRTGIVGGSKVL